MNVLDYFENELPIISVNHNGVSEQRETTINLQSSPTEERVGKIIIENIGAGTLKGSIYSNSTVVFDVPHFNGNNIETRYSLNLPLNAPKEICTNVTIASNGGEHTIKFIINVLPPVLFTEGFSINDMDSFYKLWVQNPSFAKKIFMKHDFYLWLHTINYEYIDIYEQFRNDVNKERGINNFFVLNKLKNPTTTSLYEEKIQMALDPFKIEPCTGKVRVRRHGEGFTDETLKCNVPWVIFRKSSVTTADFKQSNEIEIDYEIDRKLINKRVQYGTISLETGTGEVQIKAQVLNLVDIRLNKNYAGIKDDLFLYIKNNTKEPLRIEIAPRDNFVKFDKNLYIIKTEEAIPFGLRLSTLQTAQKSIRKQPVFQSFIRVKSHYRDKKFFQDIELLVGDFK
ncbi:MAG: DUF5717 family protein [Defluviitaleaceae bacterium]|nr:DUF5717 family protein [Defluviitaleaceae bacterium]